MNDATETAGRERVTPRRQWLGVAASHRIGEVGILRADDILAPAVQVSDWTPSGAAG